MFQSTDPVRAPCSSHSSQVTVVRSTHHSTAQPGLSCFDSMHAEGCHVVVVGSDVVVVGSDVVVVGSDVVVVGLDVVG